MKRIALLIGILGASFAQAGTITVTSPSSGDYLGLSNQVQFNINNASTEVTVNVTAVQVSNPTIRVTVQTRVTPNSSGQVSGSVNLNFTSGFPGGAYNLTVVATESGGVYNVVPTIPVTVDVIAPKFVSFNPTTSKFVRGNVIITSLFQEDNMKEWRVQVSGADIPNNTGDTNNLAVTWDSDLEVSDGQKNITITSEDLAKNKVNQTISVTLDRLPPVSTILSPNSNDSFFGNARVPVVVTVGDQFADAVDERTIDVFIRDTNGNFVTRVARRSVNSSGGNLTWTGRIRDISTVPAIFDLVVAATDKAGNAAAEQVVRIERNRSRVTNSSINALTPPDPESGTVEDKAILWKKNKIFIGLRKRH
ncbi:MAG: hypothetical protein ACKVQS_11265 [Fimbriimonadaceae bacterium]